ncbi:uncharacterized protein GJ701_001925 isoform 1-T1 [Geothlypis trichas]
MAAAPLCHVTPFVHFEAPRRGRRRPRGTSGGRRGREGAPGEGAMRDGRARRFPAPGVPPLPAGGESGEKMAAILCLRRGEGSPGEEGGGFPRVGGRCRRAAAAGAGDPVPPGSQLCRGWRWLDGLRGQRRPRPPPAPPAAAAWKNAVCHFTPASGAHRTKV